MLISQCSENELFKQQVNAKEMFNYLKDRISNVQYYRSRKYRNTK